MEIKKASHHHAAKPKQVADSHKGFKPCSWIFSSAMKSITSVERLRGFHATHCMHIISSPWKIYPAQCHTRSTIPFQFPSTRHRVDSP